MNGITINISDGTGWDEYVTSHPGSFFYHLYGWGQALEDVFKFKKFYLQAKIEGKIIGILPIVLVDTGFGKKMVSIPIGVYAGALASDDSTEKALVNRAVELTKEYNCEYLELRNFKRTYEGFPFKDLYVTFIEELPKSKEECLSKMPRKARAAARQAIDSGLSYDMGLKYLNECYEIYVINQRHLGSPVVSKRWFERLIEVFKDRADILMVKLGGTPIAAVLTFFYKDTVLPFYGACVTKYLKLNPNNYMYLKLREYGVEKEYRFFDFGRSRKEVGSYHFKINQGFTPLQLNYQYYLNNRKTIPEIDPSNKAFDLAKNIWKHLPLSVTKRLGPELFKYVIP